MLVLGKMLGVNVRRTILTKLQKWLSWADLDRRALSSGKTVQGSVWACCSAKEGLGDTGDTNAAQATNRRNFVVLKELALQKVQWRLPL